MDRTVGGALRGQGGWRGPPVAPSSPACRPKVGSGANQAVLYIFEYPTGFKVNGSQVQYTGETRIVVHNTGPRDLVFDRILAIGRSGEIVADVPVPGGKGLGARQWQIYRPQDLGLPQWFLNFSEMRSRVERLVLLSGRGRTHGSIWGVPPFLEGIFRVYLTTTLATTKEYSYVTSTAYTTYYTITVSYRRIGHSLTGEWWESADGKKWYRVTGTRSHYWYCFACGGSCYNSDYVSNNPNEDKVASGMKAGRPGALQQIVVLDRVHVYGCGQYTDVNRVDPIILYFQDGETVVASAAYNEYTVDWSNSYCYQIWGDGCEWYWREGHVRYRLQAIELVDWDTGEVYASLNQSSVQFEIHRNTIVRFKYVVVESWSRSWVVIVQPKEPTPEDCQRILNDPNAPRDQWCACAKKYLPPEKWQDYCSTGARACLAVDIRPCCTGADNYNSCLDSWSGPNSNNCVVFTWNECNAGVTKTVVTSWSASYSLKPGWQFSGLGKAGPDSVGCRGSGGSSSASGSCWTSYTCTIYNGQPYIPGSSFRSVTIVVIFKKS
ncbi:MAG: hypothetical protein QW410_03270 [Nitrososphaerota archaeon]